jgi:hypothetical protein
VLIVLWRRKLATDEAGETGEGFFADLETKEMRVNTI